MKYLKITLFFLLSTSLFAGCVKEDKILNDDSWKDEILYASECGEDGLRCCFPEEQDSPCSFEQTCCINPGNAKQTFCANSCDYGKLDNYCRLEDLACDEGLACQNSICKEAGNLSQPCLPGEKRCNEELICYQEICVECGKTGNPCCETEIKCENEAYFDGSRNECMNNICSSCGFAGVQSCSNEPTCNKNNLNNNNFCMHCGEVGEPCCAKTEESNYTCDIEQNLRCFKGFCQ